MNTKKIKAAFFDRDGTLIKDTSYLSKLSDVSLLPGIVGFCRSLQAKGYALFVITNQSGIARRYFDKEFVEKTNLFVSKLFSSHGVDFSKFYYCPHHPDDRCLCRKPLAGMFYMAAKEYRIDLSQSLMFGDKPSDIAAGVAAGCKSFFINQQLEK